MRISVLGSLVVEPDATLGEVAEVNGGTCGNGDHGAPDAARALAKFTKMGAKEIVTEAMRTAADICIFTNANFSIEEL